MPDSDGERIEGSRLSHIQERIWLLQELDRSSPVFNLAAGAQWHGELDVDRVRRVLGEMVAAHPILRSTYHVRVGVPERFEGDGELEVIVADLQKASDAELMELVQRESCRLFDLRHGPLLRCILVQRDNAKSVIILAAHHIIVDGISIRRLLREFSDRYADRPIETEALSYRDYVESEPRDPDPGQLAYWRQELASPLPDFNPLAPRRRSPVIRYEGGRVHRRVNAALVEHAQALARAEGCTVFAVYMAVWSALLSRLSDETDIIVGVPVSRRTKTGFERTIGPILNTVPLRLDCKASADLREHLQTVSTKVRAALKHADLPFEQIVHELNPDRIVNRNPFFQTMLTYLPVDDGFLSSDSAFSVDTGTSQFDLTLELFGHASTLRLELVFSKSLYDREHAEALADCYVAMLEAATGTPEGLLGDLPGGLPSGLQQFSDPRESKSEDRGGDDIETELGKLWREQLKLDEMPSRHASFFQLGGDSRRASELLARAEEQFFVRLELAWFFARPTIAGLATRIREQAEPPSAEIPQAKRNEAMSLSYSQERIWFMHQLDPQHSMFNIPAVLSIQRRVNPTRVCDAFAQMIERHEIFRTAFQRTDGHPSCNVHENGFFELPFRDLRNLPLFERLAQVRGRAVDLAAMPFDLDHPPLLRAELMQVHLDEFILVVVIHHIITDNWSLAVMLREAMASYDAWEAGRNPEIAAPTIEYLDYAAWERAHLQDSFLDSQVAYWRTALAEAPELLNLPTDYPRPAVQTYRGEQVHLDIQPHLLDQLRDVANDHDATLFMALFAGFAALLARLADCDDLVVGTPVAERPTPATQRMLGSFVNTLPIRCRPERDQPFAALLAQVRNAILAALEHQDVPFERLVELLNPTRALSHAPIFQVMLDLHTVADDLPSIPGTLFELPDVSPGAVQYDLTFTVVEHVHRPCIVAQFRNDLFDAGTVTSFLETYLRILSQIESEQALSHLHLAEPSGVHGELVDFTPERLDVLFSRQVHATPTARAVNDFSFSEVEEVASELAAKLPNESVIAIELPRGADAIVAMLATWKARSAYVWIDPKLPPQRRATLLTRCRAAASICKSGVDKLGEAGGLDPDIACLIHTSGSTGEPKAVMLRHAAIHNRLNWKWRCYPFEGKEICCQKTSLSFVDAIAEIWESLLHGVRLVIAPDDVAADAGRLVGFLTRHRVTRLLLVPTLLNRLLDQRNLGERLAPLKVLSCSGECLAPALATRAFKVLPGCRLLNLYGTTELTADVTALEFCEPEPVIPIGSPIDNCSVYVLDEALQPLPPGFPGELAAAGACLPAGHEEDLVQAPWNPELRLCRTGDFGRIRTDGRLDYLGRADGQLKLRGIRINPAEIEAQLGSHPAIVDAAVRVEDHQLCALVVVDSMPDGSVLRDWLSHRLPEYMVPVRFQEIDELPRTASGKLDRRRLPSVRREVIPHEYVAPRSELELQLVQIWQQKLNRHPIGVRDDFFELGGHSLIATELFSVIEDVTGRKLPLATLFQAPTVEQLARLMEADGWEAPWKSLVAIQPGGSKPPLFCFHGGFSVLVYRDLAVRMGEDQPVYGLQYPQKEEDIKEVESLEALVADYIAEIRTLQPCGPYHLVGSSAAGIVAWEAAQQLRAQGETVALLGLFDTWGPGYPQMVSKWMRLVYSFLHIFRRAEHHIGSLFMLPRQDKLPYLREKCRNAWLEARATGLILLRRLGLPVRDHMPEWARIFWRAMARYELQPYDGLCTLFRADKTPIGIKPDPTLGWNDLARHLTVIEVPGFHGAIISEPRCKHTVAHLERLIDENS